MEIVRELIGPEKTLAFGEELAKYLKPEDFISLFGDLGAGKTCFTQGLAKGLGCKETVTSPTFTLIHEYVSGRIPLYHFDVYRLKCPQELEGLGYEEYFYGNGVTVCEWADMIQEYLPEDRLEITIEKKDNSRIFKITAIGKRSESILKSL